MEDNSIKRKGHNLPYIYVIGLILIIVCSAIYARNIQKYVYNSLDKKYFIFTVVGVIAFTFCYAIYKLMWRDRKKIKVIQIFWITAIGFSYVYFSTKLKKHPEEAIHFIEYGLLSFLIFNALKNDIRDVTIYIVASFVVLIVGTADEIIQWMIPNRYWDLRDVGMNFLAGSLLQAAIWKGIRPEMISEKIKQKSVKILSIVTACAVIIIGICLIYLPFSGPASL